MPEPRQRTYQARLSLAPDQAAVLDAYGALYGRVERSLFAARRRGDDANATKRAFLTRFGITSRQPDLVIDAAARVARAERVLQRLREQDAAPFVLHQKQRRLALLRDRLHKHERARDMDHVGLCFGSRRLFRTQFALAQNGLSFEQWRDRWRAARACQFFVLGSADESAGNQSCQAASVGTDAFDLLLRLPEGLQAGKTLRLARVRFPYGHAQLAAALASSRRIHDAGPGGKARTRRTGTPLSYRFIRDDKGWRVFVSLPVAAPCAVSHRLLGAIGVDVNADHLAVAEVDGHGNLVRTQRLDLVLYGKRREQARALAGDAAKAIALAAAAAGKPVVLERLDFGKKKAALEGTGTRATRNLSSFAYRLVLGALSAACFMAGVEVVEVNPAYTSVIGAVNYARRRGISVHQGAACALARRGMGLSERPAVRIGVIPLRNGGHVTLALPARNRARHVWSTWAALRNGLAAAHAAHFRSGLAQAPPAPLSPATRAAGAIRASAVGFRGANRPQHCSADVLGDVPL